MKKLDVDPAIRLACLTRFASSEDAESRTFAVVASTEDLDSHGTILRQNWDLERFRANPAVFIGHDSSGLVIGNASNIGVVDGELRMDITIVDDDEHPQARYVAKQMRNGRLRGVSVGFRSRTAKFETHNGEDVLVLDDHELFELSIAGVPSNPNTLAEQRAAALGAIRQRIKSPAESSAERAPPMNAINAALGLSEDAADTAIVSAVRTLQSENTERHASITALLKAAGEDDPEKAVGVIHAARAALEKLESTEAELQKLRDQQDADKRAGIVAKLKAERKLTPAMEKDFVPEMTTKALEAFAKTAPVVLASNEEVEPAANENRSSSAKGWNDYTPAELHKIRQDDPARYAELKASR